MYFVNIKAALHIRREISQCPFVPHRRLFKQVKCVAAWRQCVCGAPMHPMRLDHLCAMYPAVTLPGSLAAGTCGALVLSAQGEL